MVTLKLKRIGKKHQASFRLVVAEKRSKMKGKFIDEIGWYNPHEKKHSFNKDRIEHWLKMGAQATPTVHNLLLKAGVIKGEKVAIHKKPTAKKTKEESKGERKVK